MRIDFERSGGFMGLRQAISLDTATLPPEEETELVQLVERANFFNLPDRQPSTSPGMDQYQYRLTIERSEASHTIFLNDSNTPETLQPLLQRLNLLVRTRR
jgi:hypothetical protein